MEPVGQRRILICSRRKLPLHINPSEIISDAPPDVDSVGPVSLRGLQGVALALRTRTTSSVPGGIFCQANGLDDVILNAGTMIRLWTFPTFLQPDASRPSWSRGPRCRFQDIGGPLPGGDAAMICWAKSTVNPIMLRESDQSAASL